MQTVWLVLLIVSLLSNVALAFFCVLFKKDICRLKGRISDVRSAGAYRHGRFGHGGKSPAEIGAELDALSDRFGAIIESRETLPQKQLIADISRDIRAPLRSLTDSLEALREKGPLGGGDGEALEIVSRKASLMHRMIEEFFELSKLKSGGGALALAPVNLDAAVQETLASCYQDFVAASVTPAVSKPDTPVTALGNRAAIGRVLSTLLFNALRHGSKSGKIAVSLWEDGALAHLSVTDYGDGIAEADLPDAFDSLYTAHRARSAMERGTGLGLAIAKQLAEKQNGSLSVRSAPGAETVFTLTLQKA